MSKKSYAIIGIIIGAVLVLMGVLTMSGTFGGAADTASSASYLYDSGYASFGADFYTYVTNNAQEAASAGRTTARNLYEIAKLLKTVLGIMLIGFGLFSECLFGMKLAQMKADETKNDETPPVPDYTKIPDTEVSGENIPEAEETEEPEVVAEEEEEPEEEPEPDECESKEATEDDSVGITE